MAIDYGKVDNNKDIQYTEGYYGAFTSWLNDHKTNFEEIIQAQLEYNATKGTSTTQIQVGTVKGADPGTHKVYFAAKDLDSNYNCNHISPAIIFSWYTDNFGRHNYTEDELNKQFQWYLDQFLNFFDEIGLTYQQLDEVKLSTYKIDNQSEWTIRFLLPIK